jgi:hypothetical protein
MSYNVSVGHLVPVVVPCLQLLIVCPCLFAVIFVVESFRLSGGDVESRESDTSTRAHTLTQKKNCTCYQSCCRNEGGCYILFQLPTS